VDTEERSSLEAAQDTTKQVTDAQEDGGDENKFQKAIGAWRSMDSRRNSYSHQLTCSRHRPYNTHSTA
jgi:hypothetical protein